MYSDAFRRDQQPQGSIQFLAVKGEGFASPMSSLWRLDTQRSFGGFFDNYEGGQLHDRLSVSMFPYSPLLRSFEFPDKLPHP